MTLAMPDQINRLAVEWGAASDAGQVRSDNQDAWAVNVEIGLFVVCDGMGGHRGGALAAEIVVNDLPVFIEAGLYRLRSHRPRSVRRVLRRAVAKQNRQVLLEGVHGDGQADMGATLALLLWHHGRMYLCNVGDSRVYRLRHGRLTQVSRDHSYIREMLDRGADPAQLDGCEGLITQHIGMDEPARPYLRSFVPQPGDQYLICSDGLTDMVRDSQIGQVLSDMPDPQSACDRLVQLANQHGGTDNITAMVIDMGDQPR